MNKSFLTAILFFIILAGYAQKSVISIAGQPVNTETLQIVMPLTPTEAERKAAGELQKYLRILTGTMIPVVDESSKMRTAEFVIGLTNRTPDQQAVASLSPDGFILQTRGARVLIEGGTHKGALYGVYELLEKQLGCHFWAPGAETIPAGNNISIPAVYFRDQPAFNSREVYYAGMDEQDFTDKMRCDRHAWKGGEDWGLWVHTMFTLVPPDLYFDKHPEYFALMGGKRTKTQLCLSNPDVLKITIRELGKRMKENPEKKYWSVSQMDTFGYCECDECRTLSGWGDPDGVGGPRQGGGTPSGSLISFVNKVAAAFPDKIISTLAYQYSRQAPANIKPAANVNIMLCTIECDRSKPLDADTSAGSFFHDLRAWSAISNDILVWDYVIQFTNMIAPFPNIPVLQPNLQLFRKYGVSSVFEQGCHGTYSELQELRQYLLAKLLWNPDYDADSLTRNFLDGYYGAAGVFIDRYLKEAEHALQHSGEPLLLYSSPMQETGSFLHPENIEVYNRLFDQAEKAVAGDSLLTSRVRKARLPLRYAILEISKKYITGPDGFLEPHGAKMEVKPSVKDQLDLFVNQANEYGVKTISEHKLTPDKYHEATMQFFSNAYMSHAAKGKSYMLSANPDPKYSAGGNGALTDGKRGSANYFVLWQGFEGVDLSAVVYLGKLTRVNYAGAEFLQNTASWIFFPKSLKISTSKDGLKYTQVAVFDNLTSEDPESIREFGKIFRAADARYVRYEMRAEKVCPDWHIGHGGKAWLFLDELVVDKR